MTRTDPGIRQAVAGDADAISSLIVRAIRETNAADYAPKVIERVASHFAPADVLAQLQDREVFVAVLGRLIVGTAGLKDDTVKTVFVRPDHQGRGIGRSPMGAVEETARARGHAVLYVPSSITAEGFYRKLGYRAVRDAFHREERTIIMEKALVVNAPRGPRA